MHYSNRLLPRVISDRIENDAESSWNEIIEDMRKISTQSDEDELTQAKAVGGMLKRVNIFYSLKYEIGNDRKLLLCNSLLLTYSRRISIPFKIKVLGLLTKIFKHDVEGFEYTGWESVWNEAIAVATRHNKSGAIANEQMNSNLLAALVGFLHASRNYIPSEDSDRIVATAMESLRDTRRVKCIEGLILLVNCLPTSFADYDKYLDEWVALWTSIPSNTYWDCYWLTLICRAKKHSRTFDWLSLGPILTTKVKELLHLPSFQGRTPQRSFFPFSFPAYYVRLVVLPYDAQKVALNKISKVLYFLSMQGPRVPGELIGVTPPRLAEGHAMPQLPGLNHVADVHAGVLHITTLLQSIRACFHPSCTGQWTANATNFLTCLIGEISRSVAKSLALKVLPDSAQPSLLLLSRRPIDGATVKYICGTLLLLIFECLYGKIPTLLQLGAGCIKNLAALDPSLGDVILPFLLSALDPAAVNQSHQAPSSLYALSLCFRSFLYPRPVVLPYLADILKLTLNGIDPNDLKKCASALNLYSTVFAWMPLGKSLMDVAPAHSPSYLDMVCGTSAPAPVDYSYHLEFIAEYSSEWALAFLDKIITVLEAKETKQKGKKSPHQIGAIVNDTFEAVFLAATSEIRELMVAKIVAYLQLQLPSNAAKDWAKILASITWADAKFLPVLLDAVLDNDVRQLSCSTGKLTFRLRLLGGIFHHCSDSSEQHLARCLDVFTFTSSDALVHHTEKSIRKQASKVKKDLVRGHASLYPRGHASSVQLRGSAMLGAPNDISDVTVDWHIPSEASLGFVAKVLRSTVFDSIDSILSSLDSVGKASVDEAAVSVKRTEERVCTLLHVMLKSLRGAAEMLGDDKLLGDAASTLMASGTLVMDAHDPSIKDVMSSVRPIVLQFLLNLLPILRNFHGQTEELRALATSGEIHKLWMKIYSSLVVARMASVKNIDETTKWHNMGKQITSSVISKTMIRILRDQEPVEDKLACRSYWLGHDQSIKTICDRVNIQHVKRLSALSYHVVWTSCRNEEESLYFQGLKALVELCEHEYDSIRRKASAYFDATASRFGSKLNVIIKPLMESICSEKTSFYAASGALSLLASGRIQKRIAGSMDMFSVFVRSIAKVQTLISAVPEQDRRERLMGGVTQLVVKYSGEWHHLPLSPASTSANEISQLILNLNGFDVSGSVVPVEVKAGLRLETLYSYLLVHLIGGDFPTTPGMWHWCLATLKEQVGQPSQPIALCALTKLAHAAVNCADETPTLESGLSFTSSLWTDLLTAMSTCQPKQTSGEDAAQWSKGIDQILNSVEYMRCVLPRSDANELDSCSFNGLFRRDNAALVANLMRLFPPADTNALSAILDCSKTLASTSEAESKAHVVTRAELFAGAFRYFHSGDIKGTPAASAGDLLLSSFFLEQTDKTSLDLCKVWAESLVFAFSVGLVQPYEHLPTAILDGFRGALKQTEGDEGFSAQGKALMLHRALLTADIYASAKVQHLSVISTVTLAYLKDEGAEICFEYRTSREEVGSILGLLVGNRTDVSEEADPIASRLRALSQDNEAEQSDAIESGVIPTKFGARSKQALETAAIWLEYIIHTTPPTRSHVLLCELLLLALAGVAHSDVEVARLCQEMALTGMNSVRLAQRSSGDIIEILLPSLQKMLKDASWRVKEYIISSTGILLMSNSFVMTAEEKKLCKNLFVECFLDQRVELQTLAQSCMTIYLSTKPLTEFATLATAYATNCGIMADREKRKRKSGTDEKVDDAVTTTVMTVASLVRAFPFDLPAFLPSLLTAVVRLNLIPSLKNVISKLVQDFKRSHQDRWDEFKESFTREQLEDIQGAGAAHYFS